MIRRLANFLKHNEEGFTLIELMVVVIILGVLAAVAIPQFTGQVDKAKDKAAEADLKTMQNAVNIYMAENGESAIDSDNFQDVLKDDYDINWTNAIDPWGDSYGWDDGNKRFYSTGSGSAIYSNEL